MKDNRYFGKYRQDYLLKQVELSCQYSPPDEERAKEHEIVNNAVKSCMRTIIRTIPDGYLLSNVMEKLMEAKNMANQALATRSDSFDRQVRGW